MRLSRSLIALLWAIPIAQAVADTPPSSAGPRVFSLTLTWEKHAPDGFEREMVLVNGQFPGPLLEINQGDSVEVKVQNNLPFNTTVHFHGIEMEKTPWSDGTPGLSQRQIKPGRSFTHKWTATQYGSYWYHSHEVDQLDDGLYGPILIHPMSSIPKPFSLISKTPADIEAMVQAEKNVQPLILSDFRHITSSQASNIESAAGMELPCFDSILFNGKGQVSCWSAQKIASLVTPTQKLFLEAGNATALTAKACLPPTVISGLLAPGVKTNNSAIPPQIFDVCTPTHGSNETIQIIQSSAADTWVAFDVIATFGSESGSFSIDQHPMYVYAVDGSYIEPQVVEAITVSNGDRYSILVKLTNAGDFTIRMASTTPAQLITGYATLSYQSRKRDTSGSATVTTGTALNPYINDAGAATSSSIVFFNATSMKSFPPDHISQKADQTFKLDIRVDGPSYIWALNQTTYSPLLNDAEPLLFNPKPNEHNNVTITTYNNTWVDLIFQLGYPMPAHPIHKHGNKMWLIGSGTGVFGYSTVAEAMNHIPNNFNLVDPPKRDIWPAGPASTDSAWMVVRYHVTNPGAWMLHCHIQSHLIGGMSVAIQDGVDKWPTVPPEYLNYH